MKTKSVRILGTRGVPAAHGGFETFAERLALYLKTSDWTVTVYCQEDGCGAIYEDIWNGVRRVRIPVNTAGAAGTIVFDWKSTVHALMEPGLVLTLGYNTAIFCTLYRLNGLTNLINMDGIEWRRQKWGLVAKTWFYLNEWAGAWLGDHLIADHPEINLHLSSKTNSSKITTIPYGADRVEHADKTTLEQYGLFENSYAILIARAEPENSIREIVRAWSRKPRGLTLLILGDYSQNHAYQRSVKEAASNEVIFLGAIYDKKVVEALRFFARLYIHGHQVGGTNPSLVEALGAGNAILAHDNRFNRWVAGKEAAYFANEKECATCIDTVLNDEALLAKMRKSSLDRHSAAFTWKQVLSDYERLLLDFV